MKQTTLRSEMVHNFTAGFLLFQVAARPVTHQNVTSHQQQRGEKAGL